MNQIEELQRQIYKIKRKVNDLERLEHAMAQNHGWIGAAWQKDPIRLGYSGTVRNSVSDTALAAGTNTLDSGAVPAGEIWIITNITVKMASGTINWLEVYMSGTTHSIFYQAPTTGIPYSRQGYWIMEPGDYMRLLILNATLNDDAYMSLIGHRVDIDQ